jgi:nicotinamidase-related amidase
MYATAQSRHICEIVLSSIDDDIRRCRLSHRSALLILDVFNTFDFPGGSDLAERTKAVVPAIMALRGRFHASGAAVVFVNDNFGRWQNGFDELVDFVVQSGGAGREIAEALMPSSTDLKLIKPRHSAMFETALPSLLAFLEVRRLLIAGIATDSCVLATVLDAHVRGYESIVPIDTTAAQTAKRTDRTLLHLRDTCNLETPNSEAVDLGA